MLKRLKSSLAQTNHTQWCLFIIFTLTLFIKCVLFQWFCCHSLLVSSILKEPSEFFAFWLPKLNIALLLASFIFLSKNKWWTFVVALIVDLWCIANLLYFRANEMLLSYEAIMMATNLSGFEGAILTYWNFDSTIFLVQTFLYGILLIFIPYHPKSRNGLIYVCILFFIFLLRVSTQVCRYVYADKLGYVMPDVLNLDKPSYIKNVIPYREVVAGIDEGIRFTGCISHNGGNNFRYLHYHSIIAYFPQIFIAHTTEQRVLRELERMGEKIDVYQIDNIDSFLNMDNMARELKPRQNLIVFIVESFESWLIEAKDDKQQLIMPNINHFVSEKANVYCSRVSSQVREGVSGDGQMIINTGLLPLQKGSAALLFGSNTFPNWAHFFMESATVYPGSGSEWNQDTMTVRYNYQKQISPVEGGWQDAQTMENLVYWLDTIFIAPFACQAVTVSTHTPFVSHQSSNLSFTNDMPHDLRKYLSCFHYTDSCLGVALQYLENKNIFENSVVVITGDHTIFKTNQLKEFKSYVLNHNLTINTTKNYVPLIICAPSLKPRQEICDICYQMDIYPTILHLIGCEDYYWKGFGVNLLDSLARTNRPISEQEAYVLSDKLIRSNYFATLKQ